MQILRTEKGQGMFRGDGDEEVFRPINEITKEDLVRLVELVLDEEEDAQFDEYDDDAVKNPAHQILYKHIVEKLAALKERREEFKDESERLYLEEYDRYKAEPSDDGSEAATA